jgi:hypothetical protein
MKIKMDAEANFLGMENWDEVRSKVDRGMQSVVEMLPADSENARKF